MPKKVYPYRELSLKNIKGERWKNIPGLEGYYKVSNYGRIKRLPYEMGYKNGAIYLKEERIIKPMVVKQRNKFKQDYTYFLTNRIIFEKVKYNFTIARLVYACFVKDFDIKDHSIFVICKDSDNFNIRPSNLKLVSIEEKIQRIISLKRYRSSFNDLTDKQRKKQRQAIINKLSKPVAQFSKNGKKIRSYPSMAAAERATGIHATSIGTRAAGRGKTAGGYIWKWGKP